MAIVEKEVTNQTLNSESAEEASCLESPRYTCAFGGSLAVTGNIYRGIPIIHAGIGCGFNQISFRSGSGFQGSGYIGGAQTPSSNISEKEVVFGGEERLREQIKSTLDLIDGDFYVVISGCIPQMIGDDIASVVKEFEGGDQPVLYVSTAGFSGNTFKGYDAFFEAVIDQLLEPLPKEKGLVNILGVVPFQDIFWRGNLAEIKKLLGKLGVEANVIIGDSGGLPNLRRLSAAELTLVVSPWIGTSVAQQLEERFQIPYFHYPNIPVGIKDTSEFLRTVGEKLGVSKEKLDSIIEAEEREAYSLYEVAGDTVSSFASAFPFAVVANSATAIGITRSLANEGGLVPTLVVINDDPPIEAREAIIQRLQNLEFANDPEVVFEIDSWKIRQHLNKSHYKLLLASSQESTIKDALIHVTVSHPSYNRLIVVDHYAGYHGGLRLIEDILSKFVRP